MIIKKLFIIIKILYIIFQMRKTASFSLILTFYNKIFVEKKYLKVKNS